MIKDMRICRVKVTLFILLSILFALPKVCAWEDKKLYSQGVNAAAKGKDDLAFIHFSSLLRKFPHSGVAEPALFAIAEYYFLIGDLRDSEKSFNKFITDYPDSKARIFALFYLLRMAEKAEEQSLVEDLEREIIGFRRASFLFRAFKNYAYTSALRRRHKALYFIDKIEFYVNGKLFTTISY